MDSIKYFLLFLVQPFWALVLYFLHLSKKLPNYFDLVLISFTISLLGIYWYPWGDPQTHFAIYYADIVYRFYQFSIFDSNYLYDYILTWVSTFFGNYVWGYFFWIFCPLLLFNISTWKYARRYKGYSYILIALILFLGNRETLDLNRNMAAALIAGSALLNYEKKFIFVLLLIIASLIHSTILILFLSTAITYYISLKLGKRSFMIILASCLILSLGIKIILSRIISGRIAMLYLEGVNAEGTGVGSGFFYLMTVCNIIIGFILLMFIIQNFYNIKKNFVFSAYMISSFITLSTWYLWTMRERFLLVNMILGFVIIIINWDNLRIKSWINEITLMKSIILLSICRLLLVVCVEYSTEYVHHTGSLFPEKTFAIVSRSFFLPAPLLLDVNDFGFNDHLYNTLFYRTKDVIRAHHF